MFSVSHSLQARIPKAVGEISQPKGGSFKICTKMLASILLLLSGWTCAYADTHFGISVDTGDQKVSWLGKERNSRERSFSKMNLSVSDEQRVETADRWNPSYDTDIDYGAYIKSFKLFLVIKKAF